MNEIIYYIEKHLTNCVINEIIKRNVIIYERDFIDGRRKKYCKKL